MTDITSDSLPSFQRVAFDLVCEIQSIKQEQGREPSYATMHEVVNSMKVELTEALRQLCRSGVLECHVNVNKIPMFSIKHQL